VIKGGMDVKFQNQSRLTKLPGSLKFIPIGAVAGAPRKAVVNPAGFGSADMVRCQGVHARERKAARRRYAVTVAA
jgi:hypothetical protein